jgi:hypothetical protein
MMWHPMALTHNTKADMRDGEISEAVGIVLTGKEGCGEAVYDPKRSRGVSIAPTSNSLQDNRPPHLVMLWTRSPDSSDHLHGLRTA